MQIHVVLPELIRKKSGAIASQQLLNGELACLIQFGFETVILSLQRNFRRWLARIRRRRDISHLAWLGFNAAATTLQTWARQIMEKRSYHQTLQEQEGAKQAFNVTNLIVIIIISYEYMYIHLFIILIFIILIFITTADIMNFVLFIYLFIYLFSFSFLKGNCNPKEYQKIYEI